MTHYFDTSNGLETVWLCGDCQDKVQPHLLGIAAVFGAHAPYIHLTDKIEALMTSTQKSPCTPAPGGRRCAEHRMLPLYPNGRCLDG